MARQFFDSAPHFRPYRWAAPQFQMGLQHISTPDWLICDATYAEFMHAKRLNLAACADRCYKTLTGSYAAQHELRSLVVTHLLEDHSERFSLVGDKLICRTDGHTWNLSDNSTEPLWQLGSLVQEDFMLLQDLDGRQGITAAANAYASSGRLVAAVGRDVRWAHEPVPDLTRLHGPQIDRILATIHEDSPCARFNWLLTPLPSLFFPQDPHAANLAALRSVATQLVQDPSLAGSLLYMRVERQTLRRLPKTRAVAFSIHTYSDPLSSITTDPAAIRALITLLKTYTPARLQYSEMDAISLAVIAWLESLMSRGNEVAEPGPAKN